MYGRSEWDAEIPEVLQKEEHAHLSSHQEWTVFPPREYQHGEQRTYYIFLLSSSLPQSGKGRRAAGWQEDHEVVSVEGPSLRFSQNLSLKSWVETTTATYAIARY